MSLNVQSESRQPGAALPSSKSPTFDTIIPGVTQGVAFTGTSAPSASALQSTTSVIQLSATAACFVKIGTGTPVAAADGTCMYLPANVVVRVGIDKSLAGVQKVAAIQAVGAGTLYVTEGS